LRLQTRDNPILRGSEEAMDCPHCNETIADDSQSCPACGHLLEARTCDRHPDREAHGVCVICGTAVCDEDNHPQSKHYLCEQHAQIPMREGWAQVYMTNDDMEAELIRDNLVADGIDAQVFSQKDHFALPVDLGDLSPVRVLVPAYDWEVAEQLIAGHSDGHGELSFACPNCGEAYSEGETICPACGEALPTPASQRPSA
jgi:hypothetical protein